MSPASKSKSKDKKVAKELTRAASKSSVPPTTGGGIPTSGYNPLLGTFHTLETAPASSAAASHASGRFRNIDETEDHSGNALGTGIDYDAVSNNDSWSGESEDHKDKASQLPVRQDVVPGADNDKREKIRQKNERKHQRQKERRAQELHEKCCGYLMSRKLEVLAQQLVGMGFSSERATMALILNEGKVEESVSWLFDGGEEVGKNEQHTLDAGGNLKIDISYELARIAELEIIFKCSKQEVERAVVGSEGDLEKAEEAMRSQKLDPPSSPTKPEETGDPPTLGNGKLQSAAGQNPQRTLLKPTSSTTLQPKRDEKDFTLTKAAVMVGSSMDNSIKNMQPLKRIQPKSDWARSQQTAPPSEKKWPVPGSNIALSSSLALQTTASLGKTEAQSVMVVNELKHLQLGSVREPVIVMQRPQSLKQIPTSSVSSSLPGVGAGWYPTGAETVRPNGLSLVSGTSGGINPNQVVYNQQTFQQQQQFLSASTVDSLGPSRSNVNGLWSRAGTNQTLAPASSLGLFSGLGSNGSSGTSSLVDWNSGVSMLPQLDYTNIDWSLNRESSTLQSGGFWPGANSFTQSNNSHAYDSMTSSLGMRSAARPVLPHRNGLSIPGLQDRVSTADSTGSREWSSPFEEKDLFSLPRQFVSSPSL